MKTRVETWCGYQIRFIEYKGEWWAVLQDICDALGLKSKHVSQRLDADMVEKVDIEIVRLRPAFYKLNSKSDISQKMISKMLIVNELGIYEALFASRKPEARKFRLWTASVLKKLRSHVGLNGYEALKLTDPHYQAQIDDILDRLYYDEETKKVMISVTVPGGDVEQVLFYSETESGK